MDRRIALTQFDASGAVLQSSTCFVSAAPTDPAFVPELQMQLRCLVLRGAAMIEAVIGADDPVLRIYPADLTTRH